MEKRYALVNARIISGKPEPFDGAVLVNGGKIEAVAKEGDLPKRLKRYDLRGAWVTPGFIDAHCHVSVFNEGIGEVGNDGNDYSEPVTAHLKAADGIYPEDEGFEDALKHGVTTLCVGPGSANVIGGQMAVVKPRSSILEEMLVTDYAGLKCAFGENPKRVYGAKGRMPTTRMGVAAVMRKALTDARNYLEKKRHHEAKKAKKGEKKEPFAVDYAMEVIAEVLEGKKPLRAHAHRADDIQTAVRIASEFGVDIRVEHATEAWRIADFLARKGVMVILGPLNTTKVKSELRYASLESPKKLEEAGVLFAIMTDAPVERIGSLFDDVRLAMRHGLSKEGALKAVTVNAAKILGLDDRLGSIEPGKDADLVVFDRDPFDFMSKVKATLIEGELKYGEL